METVHHGAIVSIRRRGQDDEYQARVQASHSLLLIPCYSRELLSRKLESTFRTLKIHVECSAKICVASRSQITQVIRKWSTDSLVIHHTLLLSYDSPQGNAWDYIHLAFDNPRSNLSFISTGPHSAPRPNRPYGTTVRIKTL